MIQANVHLLFAFEPRFVGTDYDCQRKASCVISFLTFQHPHPAALRPTSPVGNAVADFDTGKDVGRTKRSAVPALGKRVACSLS